MKRRFGNSNNPGFVCAENVVLIPFGRESYLPTAADRLHGQRVELGETTDRIVYDLANGRGTLIYSGMGGPATANALEMIGANGGRRIVIFGACGGVDPTVAVGELIVATGAVRGEGTSGYYAAAEYPALMEPELTMRMWCSAEEAVAQRVHRGVVYTTDAGYRQGPEIYERYAGMIVGVECECATAAVVGSRLGLEIGALLFCTDNVTAAESADRKYSGLANPAVRNGFEQGLRIVAQALDLPC